MKKLILILMFIYLIGIGSADIETYKANTQTNLQFTCTLNDAIPSETATFNITITDREGNKVVDNQLAEAQGSGSFNYTVTFNKTELYKVQMFCTDGIYSYSGEGFYNITPLGGELTSAKTTIYIIIFIISLIIFIGLLLIGIYLPIENNRNEMTGYIFAINNLKYLKLVCLGLAYLVALLIAYFSYTLSYSYLDFGFLTSIFRALFYAETIALFPLFILFSYVLIANLIRDSKIKDMLMRGLRIR